MSTRGEKNIIKTLTLSNNMQNNEVHILDRIGIITIIRIIFSSIIFKYVIEGRVYEWTITAVDMKNNNNNGTCEADMYHIIFILHRNLFIIPNTC